MSSFSSASSISNGINGTDGDGNISLSNHNTEDYDDGASMAQIRANIILSWVCGVLSIIGSSLILLSLYRIRVEIKKQQEAGTTNNSNNNPHSSFQSGSQRFGRPKRRERSSFLLGGGNNNNNNSKNETNDGDSTVIVKNDDPRNVVSSTNNVNSTSTIINPRTPSSLSVRRSPKLEAPNGTYQRLLAGTAVFDILFSIGWALGPIPIPQDSGAYGTYGTTTTCTIQSLLMQFGVTSFAYSTCLMIYYVLVICPPRQRQPQQRRNQRNKNSSPSLSSSPFRPSSPAVTTVTTAPNNNNINRVKRYEPWMHVYCIGFHSVVAISGLFFNVYSYTNGGSGCWIGDASSKSSSVEEQPEIETDNDNNDIALIMYGFVLRALPQMMYMLISIGCLIRIGCTVWNQYRRSKRFEFPTAASATAAAGAGAAGTAATAATNTATTTTTTTSVSTNPQPVSRRTRSSSTTSIARRQMRMTITQCFLYGIVFINSTIWPTIVVIFLVLRQDDGNDNSSQTTGPPKATGFELFLAIMLNTFYPLQGFFYFGIYIRPRYLTILQLWDKQQSLLQTHNQPDNTASKRPGTTHSQPQYDSLPRRWKRIRALYHAVIYPISTQQNTIHQSSGPPPSTSSNNSGVVGTMASEAFITGTGNATTTTTATTTSATVSRSLTTAASTTTTSTAVATPTAQRKDISSSLVVEKEET